MRLSIQVDGIQGAVGTILSSAQKVPSRAAQRINTAAFAVRTALQQEMARTFQGGVTPFISRSIWVQPATPSKLVAIVEPRDPGGKGGDPYRIIQTQVQGGDRVLKASEKQLRNAGLLQPGYYIVPGQAAVLDRYGNLSGRFMQRLLSYLQAYQFAGSEANLSAKKKARLKRQGVEFFVTQGKLRGGHLAPGIYQRRGPGGVAIYPIVMFVRKPTYQPRLRWHDVARQAALASLAGSPTPQRVLP